MSNDGPQPFDPYHKWLGIPPAEQPPTCYRLLGIPLFESDPDVIDAAADQRMAHLRKYQTGVNSALSQQLLNEVASARIVLHSPEKKAAYDAELREDGGGRLPGGNEACRQRFGRIVGDRSRQGGVVVARQ